MIFLLKIITAPVLVALMTLAARRWGPTFGGLIMGLPWGTGPAVLLLGLDKGEPFVEAACSGVLLAVIGIAGHILGLAHMARLRFGWAPSLAVAFVGFALPGVLTREVALPIWLGAGVASASLVGACLLLPRPAGPGVPGPLPWWDIPARMLAVGLLVLGISLAADKLGPTVSGIVSTYPVIMVVVGAFTLELWGADALLRLLRGLVWSLQAFVVFFLVVALTVVPWGLAGAYAAAAVASVSTTTVLILVNRGMARAAARRASLEALSRGGRRAE